MVYDFPDEKWEEVQKRETQIIKDFSDSGKMILWLMNNIEIECDVEIVKDTQEMTKWLYCPSGKLLAVNALELIHRGDGKNTLQIAE